MIEVGVVIDGHGQPIFWHVPPGATVASLPDSRDLWEVLWTHRATLSGVAHIHPGSGVPSPSDTDLTTFAACEDGLGRRLRWWIATEDDVRCFDWIGPSRYAFSGRPPRSTDETSGWLEALRQHSRQWRQP